MWVFTVHLLSINKAKINEKLCAVRDFIAKCMLKELKFKISNQSETKEIEDPAKILLECLPSVLNNLNLRTTRSLDS